MRKTPFTQTIYLDEETYKLIRDLVAQGQNISELCREAIKKAAQPKTDVGADQCPS